MYSTRRLKQSRKVSKKGVELVSVEFLDLFCNPLPLNRHQAIEPSPRRVGTTR